MYAASDDRFTAVDAVAREWLVYLKPMRVAVVKSRSELEAVFRLRYRTVVERGWLSQEDLPRDGLERDEYDDIAVHVAAWDGETLLGSLRLVFPDGRQALPTEALFGIRIGHQEALADISRVAVNKQANAGLHRVLTALLCASWLTFRDRNVSYICASVSAGLLRIYRHIGLDPTVAGNRQIHMGEVRYPVVFDFQAKMPRLAENLRKQMASEQQITA